MAVQRVSITAAIITRLLLVVAFLWAALGVPRSDPVTRYLAAGDRAARQGQLDAARSRYGSVLALGAPPAVVYERLARAHLDQQQYADAQVYLFALADRTGWNAERRDGFRRALEGEGDTARANALLYASFEAGLVSVDALHDLAQQQINALEWPQAEAVLGQLLALEPGDSQSLYQLALLLAPVDQVYARDYLLRLEYDPTWAARAGTVLTALDVYDTGTLTYADTYLGMTLAGLGEWPFAERALQLALDANAVNPTALAYRGFVRDQRGQDGLPDLQAAQAMAPNDPLVYYLLGQHWRLVGNQEQEVETLRRAYFLSPDNPALAVEVGVALQNQSDLAGAEEWFRQAVDLDPENMRWQRVLAEFYADTGFQLESTGLAFIQQAADRAPNDPDLRASLGWAYYQTNDAQRAYEELSQSISIAPDNPRSRYYFGVVLERRGDAQGAADSYWFVVQTVGPDTGFGLLAARALQRLGYAP
jgi:predicted Zn-dependent protease